MFRKLFTIAIMLTAIPCFGQQGADTIFVVYFKNDKSALDKTQQLRIDSFLNSLTNSVITTVSGYTDKNGSSTYNKKLSAKRSRHVAQYLRTAGTFRNFQVDYFGENRPASRSHALNRRVEIIVAAPDAVSEKKPPVAKAIEDDSTIIERISFENIYFVPDMAMVEFNSLSYIDKLAGVLRAYNHEKFEIRGHVNCPLSLSADTAYMKKMDKLSEARAKEVYQQLIRRGIPAENLSYLGMSNREMVYPNARTQDEQRKNMRVEVVVRRKD